jgi:hypothetical protein
MLLFLAKMLMIAGRSEFMAILLLENLPLFVDQLSILPLFFP